jgi:hypothetical protein
MTIIEATVDIGPNRQLAIQLPEEIAPGRHRVFLQIDGAPETSDLSDWPARFPRLDLGPWPKNLSLRREDLYGDDGR